MQILALREFAGVHLCNWTDENNGPCAVRVGKSRNEPVIETLVDYSHVTKDWAGQGTDVVRTFRATVCETSGVDSATEAKAVGVKASFLLVNGGSAREHHIGGGEQLALPLLQRRRREAKAGELVHAVVHHGLRIHLTGKGAHRHW